MQDLRIQPYWTILQIVFLGVGKAVSKIIFDILERLVRPSIDLCLDFFKRYWPFDYRIIIWILTFGRQPQELIRE
jgi:hypothetical protein